MSTPSNPSSLMIYKIVRTFERNGQTVYDLNELYAFAQAALNYANTLSNNNYWIADTPQIKEDLSKLCDLTTSICELNKDKYQNEGQLFAKIKIGQMPYTWLKGAVKVMNNLNFNASSANQESIK